MAKLSIGWRRSATNNTEGDAVTMTLRTEGVSTQGDRMSDRPERIALVTGL